MFYYEGEFFVIGGEENTAKNWITIKENARKSQMSVAALDEQTKKRSQSS
jgi:hypothetical protein